MTGAPAQPLTSGLRIKSSMAGSLYGVREGDFSLICLRRVAIRRLASCRFGLPCLAKCGRE